MCVSLFAIWFGIFTSVVGTAKDKGDPRTRVEALYREYGHVLERRCMRILRDEALVEDAMQEVFLTLCRCYDQYEGDPRQILSWLYRITTTHCFRLRDKDKRWLRNLEGELVRQQVFTGPSRAYSMEDQLSMSQFLDTLPEDERQAVLYRYVSGMTQEEIAEVMMVKRDKVRSWLKHFQHRGFVTLREKDRLGGEG